MSEETCDIVSRGRRGNTELLIGLQISQVAGPEEASSRSRDLHMPVRAKQLTTERVLRSEVAN
eukprot:6173628-Pleurochrysis_carterae.AAC.2